MEISPETKAPRPQEQALDHLLNSVQRIQSGLKDYFKPFDLSPQQYNVLCILKEKSPGACAAYDILAAMPDQAPDLTRLIERMKSKGLVKREVCEDNRRKVDISISYKGLDLLEAVRPGYEAKLRELVALDNDESELLIWLLKKMAG